MEFFEQALLDYEVAQTMVDKMDEGSLLPRYHCLVTSSPSRCLKSPLINFKICTTDFSESDVVTKGI